MTNVTTNNPGHGFYGTISAARLPAARLFSEAVAVLRVAYDASADEARELLDSSYGRHLADRVVDDDGDVAATLSDPQVRRDVREGLRRLLRARVGERGNPAAAGEL
jgi:hypothetical protein